MPLLVQAAVFTAFTLASNTPPLTPDLAFPALALLNQLSLPLFFLPDQIGAFVQGRVSISRIQAFLDEPEMQQLPFQPAAAKGAAAVAVRHGVYSWEPGERVMRPMLEAWASDALLCLTLLVHCCSSRAEGCWLSTNVNCSTTLQTWSLWPGCTRSA